MPRACLPSAALIAILMVSVAQASDVPIAVSPGEPDRVAVIGTHCPTFTWTPVPEASAHELVVYQVTDNGQEVDPVLRRTIPGAASAWTPSLGSCLESGRRYAWSVRAIGANGSATWSAPSPFEVPPAVSVTELEQALAVLRQHLAFEAESATPKRSSATTHSGPERAPIELAGDAGPAGPSVPVGARGSGHMVIDGEVRTVDGAGGTRLWGQGRPNTGVYRTSEDTGLPCRNGATKFGLSAHAVQWGSAASACPAGTWVCRLTELIACDTDRPDGSTDVYDCGGIHLANQPMNLHVGWIADALVDGVQGNLVLSEQGTIPYALPHCSLVPVWCCWE